MIGVSNALLSDNKGASFDFTPYFGSLRYYIHHQPIPSELTIYFDSIESTDGGGMIHQIDGDERGGVEL